jgi:hypothetical protein
VAQGEGPEFKPQYLKKKKKKKEEEESHSISLLVSDLFCSA